MLAALAGMVWSGLAELGVFFEFVHTKTGGKKRKAEGETIAKDTKVGLSKRGRNYRLPLTLRKVKCPPSLRRSRGSKSEGGALGGGTATQADESGC